MKKVFGFVFICAVLSACSTKSGPLLADNQNPSTVTQSQNLTLRHKVSVKARGANYVTYEYADVQIDQILPMAEEYCAQKDSAFKAELREIVLHRNQKRRATFDCRNLAKAE